MQHMRGGVSSIQANVTATAAVCHSRSAGWYANATTGYLCQPCPSGTWSSSCVSGCFSTSGQSFPPRTQCQPCGGNMTTLLPEANTRCGAFP